MRIKKILLIVTPVLVLGLITLVLLHFLTKPEYSGNLTADIESEIKITRDGGLGIPAIEASSMNDVFFALGYVHAQDRMPVMEYYRMIAGSSSASLLGEDGLIIDRLVRIIGIRSAALKILNELTPKHKDYLNAYAAGINKSKRIWKKFLPAGVIERQWESRDIVAILLLREWSNAFLNNTELVFPMSLSPDRGQAESFIPLELQAFYNEELAENVALLRKIKNIVESKIGIFQRGFAFAMPSGKGTNADTVSAFGLQSQYSIYPDWYPVSIKCGAIQIHAVTSPGLPFMLSGRSDNITFYGINLDLDTQDFIFHEVRMTDGLVSYMGTAGWKDFLPVPEPEFTQAPDEKHYTVYHTETGPILNDVEDSEYKRYVVSLKYLLPKASYISSLFELPLSENTIEAISHTRSVNSMPRIYLISNDERQSVLLSGSFPIRQKNKDVISSRYFNWNGVTDLSGMTLPAGRYAVIGNNVTQLLPQALRAHSLSSAKWLKRFEELVREASAGIKISPDSLKKILNDTYTPDCEKFLPVFMKNLEANPVTSSRLSRIYFNKWERLSGTNSVAALLFHSILLDYIRETFAGKNVFNIDDVMDGYQLLTDNFYKILSERFPHFSLIETPEDVFDRAFLKTLRKLSRGLGPVMDQWEWGKIHRNAYKLPLKTALSGTLVSEWGKDSPLPGGIGSILNGNIGADLRPKYASSMTGVFAAPVFEITMDFPCSLHPRSPFEEKNISFRFDQMEQKHVTTITKLPGK